MKELKVIVPLIKSVGDHVHNKYVSGVKAEFKQDGSPVTLADKEANQLILETLSKEFPEDHIVSEEAPEEIRGASERVWYVDPIDGTKDFLKQNGEWSVIIGLCIGGRPAFGSVYYASQNKVYVGGSLLGETRMINGKETAVCQVDQGKSLADLVLTHSRNHYSEDIAQLAEHLEISQSFPHGSIGLKHSMIVENKADCYFNLGGKFHYWDICAGEAILDTAGASLFTEGGRPIEYKLSKETVSAPMYVFPDSNKNEAVTKLSTWSQR